MGASRIRPYYYAEPVERPWPLTGRDRELRRVVAAVRPGAAGVVVAGTAGVGKTRLARDAVAGAEAGGLNVIWAHGSAAVRPMPLGAFAGLLDMSPGDAADSINRALRQLAKQRPLVLVVDDAHLLDEHSAIVLDRVVVRRLGPVVVTVRTGEPALDIVASLWKDEHLPRLELRPLSNPDTTELVSRVLGGPVDSASADRLWTMTQGSPLFLRHLLAGEVGAGRFNLASGIWRWESQPSPSPELIGLLEDEIGELAPGVQDVVDIVALAEPVAVESLIGLTSRADVEVAEHRGLVSAEESVARLAHPLYGEIRRAIMGSVRARRLRGLVAQTLAGSSDPIPQAVLTLDSDLPADPALFLRAARAATAMYDLPLAERLAKAAAATGDPNAQLVHAGTLSWLGRGEEAEAILASLVNAPADQITLTLAHLYRAGNLVRTGSQLDAARRPLEEAAAVGAAPQLVTAMTLSLAASAGDFGAVLERGPALMREELPDDMTRVVVASAVSAAAAVTGSVDLLAEAAIVGGLTGNRVPTTIPAFGLADLQVLGHYLHGTPHLADEPVRRMRVASADLPGPARFMGLLIVGHAALAGGRIRDAVNLLREAWAGFAESTHEARFRCRTALATALSQAGHEDLAAPLLGGIATERHPLYWMFRPDDLLARAWGAAAEGSTTEAIGHAVAAADFARDMSAPAYEVLAWQTTVQFGDAAAAMPRLTSLADLSPRAALALRHALAWAAQDANALLTTAQDWAQLGDLLAAGDAAAQASDVNRRQGRRGSALSAATLAHRFAAQSGARTPALAIAERPLPLTAREREIVTLAARGLSNKQIAERLTVSTRTVEGHLYRAGRKVGASERAAFAAILGVG